VTPYGAQSQAPLSGCVSVRNNEETMCGIAAAQQFHAGKLRPKP
jgi:hypothetical protein